jgi:hypothetical protein
MRSGKAMRWRCGRLLLVDELVDELVSECVNKIV